MPEESPATRQDILALGENLGALLKEELGRIDRRLDGLDQRLGELDQRLGGLEVRFGAVESRLDALEQRVDRLELRLNESLHEVEVKLTKRMDDFAASLEEEIRDAQTEILKAMLTAQESNLARFKDIDPLRERMAILERRLLEIEMRLHIPPAA